MSVDPILLDEERREWAEMLLAGDAMLGYVHELNNSLNSMMLQASVLELKAGEAIRSEVELIRKLGKEAASKLAQFARHRERYRQVKTSVDLNQAARELFTNDLEAGNGMATEFWPSALTLHVHPLVLKLLISVMLRIAKPWHKQSGSRLRTIAIDKYVWLVIEPVSKETGLIQSSQWTDLAEELGEPLEILAAQSRARLVEAKLQVAVDASGNRALAANWAAA